MTSFCGAAAARAATTEGRLDEDDLDRLIETHRGRVALVTVSGASNVTGFVPPIHRLARKAHAAGARLLVDAARLAAHRPINVKPDDDPEHLDFVVLSGHKMYAPFGTGALVGAQEVFQGAPEYQGGSTVDVGKVIDYNTSEDLDALVEMLVPITEGRHRGACRPVTESGDYVPGLALSTTVAAR